MIRTLSAIKPKALAIVPAFTPSTQINVITPLLDLCVSRHLDFRLQLESTVSTRDIDWANLVVLCRNVEPGHQWFEYTLKQNKPYIYDIDDNFFDISGDSLDARYHRSPERLDTFTRYLRYATLVRVYSEPLRQRVLQINDKVVKVVPPMDFRHIRPRRAPGRTVKIVYATSRAQDELFSIFLPALEKILNDYNGKIEAYFLGFTPPTLRKHARVHSVPMIWDYPAYLRRFSSAGYDIGLAPLLDDIFHRSKTNNKFREYGACQIAGIYSDVDVYSSCVSQMETGILVSNTTEAWYDAIKLLIENQALREKIQLSAYQFVQEHYSQQKFVQEWADQIQSVLVTQTPEQSKDIAPLSSTLVLKTNNQINFLHKIERRVSHPRDWFSLFPSIKGIIQRSRRRFWTLALLAKYKIILWLISIKR